MGLLGPASTTMINLKMNLDARTAVTFPGSGMSINFADSSTYNSSTSVTVYDARGQRVDLALYFQKAAANTWNLYATANGLTVAGAGLAPVAIASLTLSLIHISPSWPTPTGSRTSGHNFHRCPPPPGSTRHLIPMSVQDESICGKL